MTGNTLDTENRRQRTLVFSQRNIHANAAYRCPHYEFEDIICQIDSAEILAPWPGKRFALGTRLANRAAEAALMALNLAYKNYLKKNTTFFLRSLHSPRDLLNFNVVKTGKNTVNFHLSHR
jgi:hypothetical protein